MKQFPSPFGLIIILFITACAMPATPDIVYQRLDILPPTLSSVPVCRSYGCAKIDRVALTDKDQKQIKDIFKSNKNAESERQNIQSAIAAFETIMGNKTGTAEDVGGTYVRLGHNQQDCVDESTNTTTYLLLLDQMNLLKFHQVNALTTRSPFLSGNIGPHRTAVITDTEAGQKFAVDSWFHDNGVEPEIIELDTWKNGWHPETE